MQNILAHWQSLPREDLFQFWQDELALKKELRTGLSGYREIKLNSEAEYDFLRHSLAYSEYKEQFLTILFFNMNCQPVQNAVSNGPVELYLDFLLFLPQLLCNENLTTRALQFLINIYREDFHAYFIDIVQSLTEADCDYLIERTANKSLRQLLRDRRSAFVKQNNDVHYGLLNPLNNLPKYPGLYGDKIQIISQAIASIQSIANKDLTSSTDTSGRKLLLETADLLFMAGLLDDCLSLLLLVYRQEISFSQDENSLNFKSLNKILRKSLPIYFLLKYPSSAYQHNRESYQTYFPNLLADEASLLYLDLYATLLANYQGNSQYTLLELTQNNNRKDHGENNILLAYLQNPDHLAGEAFINISQYAHEKISAQPHESFIIMEIIRWLEQVKRIQFTRDISNRLLRDYLQLFQWIPSPMFINNDIRNQLAVGVDEPLKNEVDRILNLRDQYSFTDLRELYTVKPDYFRDSLAKQLLLGSFLGVF